MLFWKLILIDFMVQNKWVIKIVWFLKLLYVRSKKPSLDLAASIVASCSWILASGST